MSRFGLGGYFTNEELEGMGEKARFLNVLFREVSEMGEGIFELCREFEKECLSMKMKKNEILYLMNDEEVDKLNLFKDRIEEWTTDYFINENWVIDSILKTFQTWFENDTNMYKFFLSNPTIGEIRMAYEKEFPDGCIKIPIYYAYAEKESDYKLHANQIVMEHIKKSRAIFEEKMVGYIPAKEKRTHEHYKWFIHYHVFGKSLVDTADEFGVDEGKVRTQINKLYQLLELERNHT